MKGPVYLAQVNPKGMRAAGNLDLSRRPVVHNADGSISTVRSISIGTDGGEVLIPTVIGNRVVSNDEAIKHYQQTGENLGTFDNTESADAYAQSLHEQQAQEYVKPEAKQGEKMTVLDDFRQKYPQYQGVPDGKLAAAIRQKYYADMPPQDFYRKAGLTHLVGLSEKPEQAPERSGGEDLARAAIMTGRDVIQGAAGIPAAIHDATVMPAYNAIAKAVGSDSRINPGAQQIDANLNSIGIPNPQPENATERVVSGIDRGLGGLITGAGIGSAAAGSTNAVARGVGGALTSNMGAQTAATVGGVGASEVAREAGYGPAAQIGLGLAGGMSPAIAGASREAVLNGASRIMAKPSQETSRLAQIAMDNGIPLKASQVSPSQIAKQIDSVSAQVPFSGSGAFQDQQRQAFNRAVSNTIGEDSTKLTSDVMERARQRIGQSYDDLAQRVQAKVTPQVQQKLDDVLQNAKQYGNDDSVKAVNSALERLKEQAPNGILPGPAFKSLDSQLGQISANGGEKGNYAKQLRGVLRQAFNDSAGPDDAAKMRAANQQYANLKTIEPLVAKDSVQGNVSPQGLLGRVAANKAGKSAMAYGRRGDLGDLANIGKQFMGEAKDSGTAVRNQIFDGIKTSGKLGAGLLAGSVVGLPTAIMGGLGSIKTARSIQKLMQNPALVEQLLGKVPKSQIARLLQLSADPTAQSVIQSGR